MSVSSDRPRGQKESVDDADDESLVDRQAVAGDPLEGEGRECACQEFLP